MSPDIVRAGIAERWHRLGVETIDLLQLHWWTFEHPGYIDAMRELVALRQEGRIRHIGVTNFDTDHLRLLVRHGFPVVSNQVSFSLLDRRAAERMSAFCLASGVRLLAYGTLGGGFLTDRWVGAPEPDSIADWSKIEVQALHRRDRRLVRAPDRPRGPAGNRRPARRIGGECRDALGARTARGRGGDRRRATRRARAPGRQRRPVLLRARCRRPGADRRGAGRHPPDPGRLRRRVPPPALPHGVRRPQPSPGELSTGLHGGAGRSPPGPHRASIPAACGNRSAATAARCGSATASW